MSIENTKRFLSARDNSGFWNKPSSLPTPTGLSLWPLSFESPSCRWTQPGLLMAPSHRYGRPLCHGAGVGLWDGWKWKRKLPSHVWLCDPGILQARVLEWVAVPFSRGLPNPGIDPRSPTLQVDSLPAEPQRKPKNTGVGSLGLLQRIFPTQEWNRGLLHCRRVLYQLSYLWQSFWDLLS